jgi:hypothetical protein
VTLPVPVTRFSRCGRYRYSLERRIGRRQGEGASKLAWLMLNPSTADAVQDDPTIRKVIGFTRRAGFDTAVVVNLYAWRATDPRDLRRNHARAEGERNREAVVRAAMSSDAVVCAWGALPWVRPQAQRAMAWLADVRRVKLLCLGRSKHGAPLHPLMLSYAEHPLVQYAVGSGTANSNQE